jgi:RsiW-degrading membrane proteinase PrsW (M82 family)
MLVLAMVLAAVWGLFQLAVLGSPTRSVRAGTLLLALGAGLYGCGVLAVGLQFAWTRLFAAATGVRLHEVVRVAAYTVDPYVEEIVKVLPLLLLAWSVRARWQRGLTDHVLLGAATGAGFGLLEALVRFGSRTGSAIATPGGWVLPVSLSPPMIPSPWQTVTSWLPAPVNSSDLFAFGSGAGTDLHLAWSAVAGLGIGLAVRGRGPVRLAGPVLVLLAGADHAAYNYDLLHPDSSFVGDLLSGPFVAARGALWLWPLLALATAVLLDRRALRRGRDQAPDLRLRRERSGGLPVLQPARYLRQGLPWTLLVVPRFVLLRRSALYRAEHDPDDPLPAAVAAARDQLDAADSPAAWRGVGRLALTAAGPARIGPLLRRGRPLLLWAALLVPAFLYYVAGSTRYLHDVQDWLEQPGVFHVLLLGPGLAVLALLAWQLAGAARALPAALRAPDGDAAARLQLRLATGAGAGGLGLVLLAAWLDGTRPQSGVLNNVHVLDALSSLLLVAGIALVIAAVLFFPPSIGLAVMATGTGLTVLVPTIAVSGAFVTAATLGVGSILLSQAAGRGSGSGSSGGSGGGSVPDIPQGPVARPPAVRDYKLKRIVDSLFREPSGPNHIGDGSTMDAVRNELLTGRPTGGSFHSIKANNTIRALNRWLAERGPGATRQDRLWAQELREQLKRVLEGP